MVRKILPKHAIRLAEETYRKSRAYGLSAINGFPAETLKVIGVTGTNGKTTTCNFINEMLKNAGYKTAMYTTAVIEINEQSKLNESHRTVPLTAELIAFLKKVKKAKVDFVVMEITSMALDQHKMIGIPIEVAVMTNLSQEHLDYHKSMENYAKAKARLFNKYMHPHSAVLNRDDEWYEYFAKAFHARPITYGRAGGSKVKIKNTQPKNGGSDFTFEMDGKNLSGHIQLLGEFNVYNGAAAAGVGVALGLDHQQIISGLAALKSVPGRMQKIEAGQDFEVIVDYAVTPDALAKALQAAAQSTSGKVISVFGATGDRDKSKRPLMGEVAAKYADKIFLTDDETYSEDGAAIRRAVYEGIVKGGGADKTAEIADRKAAIKQAISSAKKGDVVLLTGIGHQNYRAMGGKKEAWDEVEVAREILRA